VLRNVPVRRRVPGFVAVSICRTGYFSPVEVI
jgi:hypothetical protein